MTNINKRKIGAEYEKIAADYLVANGYQIVERNWYTSSGEIDLIARQGSTLIFIEIKYRSSDTFGNPLEAVNRKKQIRISKAAMQYYAQNGYEEGISCRFDVIAIYKDGTIQHIENAFDYGWR